MKIVRILNNNSIVARNEKQQEYVLFGSGLGFQKARGDTVDESKIEKKFAPTDDKVISQFVELVNNISMDCILYSQQIIEDAKVKYGKKLVDTIYISLPDHISNAIENARGGIYVRNPLLHDIKRFYKDEFSIGISALELIHQKTGIELPEDEAAHIALHFVNAEIGEGKATAIKLTEIMQEISNIVKDYFKIEYDENSLNYYRYITHLKFFAQRILNNTNYPEGDKDVLELVINKYKKEYECVVEVSRFIEDKFGYVLSSDELLYLTIHISRVVNKVD
ncbi:PRD domain-containing protein [Anaerocolumna sp. AGMB13020]|uniref:BglG family transcription antiterminator LicT n=1 Tax=Anaerocolumna sp. AGMB13020 TaxID=3081750 RepID=UPI002952AA83|nr:PRD domain-containing protein [Anaerocolumna sp. AGMB13020]WOO37325.1 PRD domain-containing protein [Anaerocolumna sp. AGMB13020]